MFIVPLSLFLISTYLRPRTEAELSYLITAIECLSGLWCLLFAPFQIQLSLIGLVLLRNTSSFKSLINRQQPHKENYLDLSDASSPAIDIEATPVIPLLKPASQVENPERLESFTSLQTPLNKTTKPEITSQHQASIFQNQPLSHSQASSAITIFRPQLPHIPIQPNDSPPPQKPIVIPTQLVQMQYRGTTYVKSIPTQ